MKGHGGLDWDSIVQIIRNGQILNLLGWPKGPFIFFHKIKDTFSFSPITIDLDILSMLAIFHYGLLVGGGQGHR